MVKTHCWHLLSMTMFYLSPADTSHTDNPSMSVIVMYLKVIKFIIKIIIFWEQ